MLKRNKLKPFSCTSCDESFVTYIETQLTLHVHAAHQKIKSFTQKGSLTKHHDTVNSKLNDNSEIKPASRIITHLAKSEQHWHDNGEMKTEFPHPKDSNKESLTENYF